MMSSDTQPVGALHPDWLSCVQTLLAKRWTTPVARTGMTLAAFQLEHFDGRLDLAHAVLEQLGRGQKGAALLASDPATVPSTKGAQRPAERLANAALTALVARTFEQHKTEGSPLRHPDWVQEGEPLAQGVKAPRHRTGEDGGARTIEPERPLLPPTEIEPLPMPPGPDVRPSKAELDRLRIAAGIWPGGFNKHYSRYAPRLAIVPRGVQALNARQARIDDIRNSIGADSEDRLALEDGKPLPWFLLWATCGKDQGTKYGVELHRRHHGGALCMSLHPDADADSQVSCTTFARRRACVRCQREWLRHDSTARLCYQCRWVDRQED